MSMDAVLRRKLLNASTAPVLMGTLGTWILSSANLLRSLLRAVDMAMVSA